MPIPLTQSITTAASTTLLETLIRRDNPTPSRMRKKGVPTIMRGLYREGPVPIRLLHSLQGAGSV